MLIYKSRIWVTEMSSNVGLTVYLVLVRFDLTRTNCGLTIFKNVEYTLCAINDLWPCKIKSKTSKLQIAFLFGFLSTNLFHICEEKENSFMFFSLKIFNLITRDVRHFGKKILVIFSAFICHKIPVKDVSINKIR